MMDSRLFSLAPGGGLGRVARCGGGRVARRLFSLAPGGGLGRVAHCGGGRVARRLIIP